MSRGRLRFAVAALPAVTAGVAVAVLCHDRPHVYDVGVRLPAVTGYLGVTWRHVIVGGWRTADRDAAVSPLEPIWTRGPVAVYSVPRAPAEERDDTDAEYAAATGAVRLGEFGCLRGGRHSPIPSLNEVMVPSWAAAAASVVPLGIVVGRRARRRAAGGRCLGCGYDLRAPSGRCPECGAEPPVAGAAPTFSAASPLG